MAGAYRRFYLYSALSIAVLAVAIALTVLIALVLRMAGLSLSQPTDAEIRSAVALTSAILLVAIPVGVVHYLIIRRALRGSEERKASIRHFYLNFWIFVALLAALIAVQVLANATAPGITGDRASPLAAGLVAAAVGIVGWRWRATTPPRNLRWENDAAYGAMVLALLIGLSQLAGAVDALVRLRTEVERFPGSGFPGSLFFLERQAWTGAWTSLAALAVWAICAIWQWQRRMQPIRLRYLVTFYGLGVLLLAAFLDVELAAFARWLLGHGSARDATTFLPQVAVAVVLVALHAPLLVSDRGRNGRPAEVADRLAAAPISIAGIGLLAAAAAQGWTFVVDHVLVLGGSDDPADHAAAIAVSLALGLASYPLAWRALRSVTAGDAVRRFVLFTAVCVALAGGVIAAATALFALISGLLAGALQRSETHTMATWGGIAAIAFAVFVWQLAVLRRERREVVAEPLERDALLDMLEAVARGELTPMDALARIRASS